MNDYRAPVPPVIAMDAIVHTPRPDHLGYPYRDQIVALVSLIGVVTSIVVLGAGPARYNDPRYFTLSCYAICTACAAAPHDPGCHPTGFYLDPVSDPAHYQAFQSHQVGAPLTASVTFKIPHRPRRPKGQDQSWRCASESLTLTYYLSDHLGRTVAMKSLGPFRPRPHTKRRKQD